MRFVYTLIGIIFSLLIQAQDIGPGYEGMDDGEYLEKAWHGKPRLTYTIKNGKLDGEHKDYFFSGRLKSIITFNDGMMDGNLLMYSRRGQLEVEGVYRNDTLISYTQTEFYRNGRVKMDRTILFAPDSLSGDPLGNPKNSMLGGQVVYDPNKKFANLPSTGRTRQFYKTGELMRDEPLVKDKRHGPCRSYCSNGELFEEYNCVDDEVEGECKVYNCEGVMIKIEKWDKGKKISERRL